MWIFSNANGTLIWRIFYLPPGCEEEHDREEGQEDEEERMGREAKERERVQVAPVGKVLSSSCF